MTYLINKHKDFIAEMLNHQVGFVLIGGYAVIYHGYVRTTGDLDIWLQPGDENKERFLGLLTKLGYSKDGINRLRNSNFSEALAFHIGKPPERIDFLTQISGVRYEEALQDLSYMVEGNLKIPVISYKNLILNKMLSSRMKDQADVEELSRIKRKKGY